MYIYAFCCSLLTFYSKSVEIKIFKWYNILNDYV